MRLSHLLLPALLALACAACDAVSFGSGPSDPSSADTAASQSSGYQTVVLSDGTITQALPLGSGPGPQLVQPIGADPQIGTPLD